MNSRSPQLLANRIARPIQVLALALALLSAVGCGADQASDSTGADYEGPVGLSPAGAQDFGAFRAILEAGDIPAPNTLDDLGFFAEHKLVFPAPDCGNAICLHGLLAVMGNLIDGVNCTLIVMGLNTTLDPAEMQRPPLHVVLAIDVSGSMANEPISYVKLGLRRMLDKLEDGDEVSLVTYSDRAELVVDRLPVATHRVELEAAIDAVKAGGSTNVFDGLLVALDHAHQHFDPSHQNRVILLSDGVATAGIQSDAKAVELATTYAQEGIGLTTIGVGAEFDVGLMQRLGEVGAGNFYFLEDAAAVAEVFAEEVSVFMVPVATDVRIQVDISDGYVLREAFGTSSWRPLGNAGEIEIPALFLAGRTDTGQPPATGRRGGGGAMLVEAMPSATTPAGDESYRVGTLTMDWTDPATGASHTQVIEVLNTALPGKWPVDGIFEHNVARKAFAMLNLYVGFRMASSLATAGDVSTALGVLQALRQGVATWLIRFPDGDLEDDLAYVDLFIDVLEAISPGVVVVTPPSPWPMD